MDLTIRDYMLSSLQDFLLSGRGMVVMALGFAFMISMFISPRARWWGMALMIFATGLAAVPSTTQSNVIYPLEILRSNGRAISSALMLMLLMPMLAEPRTTFVTLSRPLVAYFIFALSICGHEILLGSDLQRGMVVLLLYPVMFTLFGIALARTLDGVDSVERWLRMFAMSSALTIFVTLVQTLIDADQIVQAKRMFGLTANPNMLASYLACGVPVVCHFITRPGTALLQKFFYAMLLGLMGVFILWTGSRGGLLMAIVGLVVLFRLRIGKFALTAVAGISCYLIARIFFGDGVSDIAGRMFSTEDTRSGVWQNMIAQFIRNPIFGAGITEEGSGGSENSILLTASKYGLVGLVPLLIFISMTVAQMFRLERLRAQLPPLEESLVRVINASLAAMLIYSMFDGTLLSLWAPLFCLMVLMLAVANAFEQQFGYAPRGFEVGEPEAVYAQPSLR